MSNEDAVFREAMEFLSMTSLRHVPAFFLGCVFLLSLQSLISFSVVQHFWSNIRTSNIYIPDPETISDEKAYTLRTTSSSLSVLREPRSVFFVLYLCFVSASITFFASLLTFPPSAGAACAFVVAWSGITSQASRVFGLLIIFFDLRQMSIRRWESVGFTVLLLVGTILIFVNNAIATGTLRLFQPIQSALCERKHVLPISFTLSAIFLALEGYSLIRTWQLLAYQSNPSVQRTSAVFNYRTMRAATLLLLEGLTLVPSAIPTNIVGESVPYSIGALAVLVAFTRQDIPAVSESTLARPSSPTFSEPVSSIPPVFNRQLKPPPNRQSNPYALQHNPTVEQSKRPISFLPINRPFSYSSSGHPVHKHPFASIDLEDEERRRSEWIDPPTARSSRTVDSSAVNAIIQVAQRAKSAFALQQPDDKNALTVDGENIASPSPNSANPLLSRSIVPSPTAFAASLGLETTVPPKVVPKPSLTILTTSKYDENRPESASILPLVASSSGNFRLTPTFMSPESAQAPSSLGHGVRQSWKSNPSSPRSADLRQSMSTIHFTDDHALSEDPGYRTQRSSLTSAKSLKRNTTFGRSSRFRAAGYTNPIQNRWSGSTPLPAVDRSAPERSPRPLPMPPMLPPLREGSSHSSHSTIRP